MYLGEPMNRPVCVRSSVFESETFFTRPKSLSGSAANSSKQSRLAKLRSRMSGALRCTWAAVAARMNFQPHDIKSQFKRGLM